MAVTFDSSWDYGVFSLWGWLSATQVESDNALRNEITHLHRAATQALNKLRKYPKTSKRGILKRQWRARLEDLDRRAVSYGEGLVLRDELAAMLVDINDTLMTEAREASEPPQTPLTTTQKSTGPKPSKAEADDSSDDAAFAANYLRTAAINGGPSKVTARQPVRTEPAPPPTPAQLWKDEQRRMANDCAQVASSLQPGSRGVVNFGAHGVTQEAVLRELPAIEGAQWLQGRPDHSGKEVRVMVAVVGRTVVCTLWANGLSHDGHRLANDWVLYEQDGSKARFVRRSDTLHPKDPGP